MRLSSTNIFKRTEHQQRGASAVEMALLLPLLVLMLDGVLEFGLILHNQSVLISAANIAARAGIAQGPSKRNAAQIAIIAINDCKDRLISLGSTSAPTVTVMQATDPSYPNPLQVTVYYSFRGLLSGGLLAAVQAAPELSATAVMFNE